MYDTIHLALWSVLIAGLIFLGIFGISAIPAGQAYYQALRAQQIEAEDAFYCRKWGMVTGSGKERTCMADLLRLRRSVEKRLADESLF